ncbi:hypothetical protein ACWEPN_16500 [Nonomuraea wenchangensis]
MAQFDRDLERARFAAMAMMLAAGLVVGVDVPASSEPSKRPPVPQEKVAAHTDAPLGQVKPPPNPGGGEVRDFTTWPNAGETDMVLAGARQAGTAWAGTVPVSVASKSGLEAVRVKVADRATARRAAVPGVVVALSPTRGTPGKATVGVGYASFQRAVGTGSGARALHRAHVPVLCLHREPAGGPGRAIGDMTRLGSPSPDAPRSTAGTWLSSRTIVRTAHAKDGRTLSSPPVEFTSQLSPNRVAGYDGNASMPHWRLTDIATDTGSIIHIRYSREDCTADSVPDDLANNHKYVVERVEVQDRNAISPTQITTYRYLGHPAWPKYRTHGQFRGYSQVEVRTGDTENRLDLDGSKDKQTLTRTTYYRGTGGQVENSLREKVTDHDAFASEVHEPFTRIYERLPPRLPLFRRCSVGAPEPARSDARRQQA